MPAPGRHGKRLARPPYRSGDQRCLRIGGDDVGLGKTELAAHDVGSAHERHHLIEGMQPAHSLPAKSAIGRYDYPLRGNDRECTPDEGRDLLRPLHLQATVADHADGDLLTGADAQGEAFELVAAVVGRFEGDYIDVELVEER